MNVSVVVALPEVEDDCQICCSFPLLENSFKNFIFSPKILEFLVVLLIQCRCHLNSLPLQLGISLFTLMSNHFQASRETTVLEYLFTLNQFRFAQLREDKFFN